MATRPGPVFMETPHIASNMDTGVGYFQQQQNALIVVQQQQHEDNIQSKRILCFVVELFIFISVICTYFVIILNPWKMLFGYWYLKSVDCLYWKYKIKKRMR